MEIGLSILILWCFIFTVIGAVLMLLLQYYIYVKFSLLPEPTAEQNAYNAKYSLPAALNATARNFQKKSSTTSTTTPTTAVNASTNAHNNETDTTSLMALNFVMQFLFHELKNSNRVRKWFYRKLSLELDELIAKTTTGKLFDKLTIKQLELGDQFPEIKTLKVHNIELDDAVGRIENLDLLMELRYNGNFRTSIDADMVLGKKGSLTLKVKQLFGVARLQFTRNPYTHWSLSFLGDPELDLDIESKYQGRQMQSNITSLISNQIRKAIRRKHTLPNYKIRYKPFFHKTSEEDAGEGDIQPNGMLEVKVSEISRLMCPQHLVDIYCTLTMASVAFVESRQHDDRHVLVSLDVEIHKAKNQQIGIIFKQASVDAVEIEAILPNTPAFKSNLKLGDILLAIEGKRVATIQQVAKVIKNIQSNILKLRIDRVIPGIIRNDAILEDLDLYEDLGDNRTGYGSSTYNTVAKAHDPEVNVKQTALRTSTSTSTTEKGASSESSLCSTPTNSPKKTKLITKALKKTISRDFGDDGYKAKSKSPIKLINSPKNTAKVLVETLINTTSVNDVEHFFQHSTIDCKLAPMISMEDLSQFKLDANCRYLNICVYGKCGGENQLLAFTNISINNILMECSETSLSHSFRICELSPPIPQDLKTHYLSAQSGFNPNLCFGDLLLTFTWDGNPNISMNADFASKTVSRVKAKSVTSLDKTDDSGYSDTISLKSVDTLSMYSRSHNFVRTHFQRATQCDFCGKKIWLKDAVQCRDCYMCCHKKCINKCQNATVCGPVDCSATAPTTIMTTTPAPEFMVTEPESPIRTHKADLPINTSIESSILEETKSGSSQLLEVQRSSFAGILNQSMKRVNSVNNLAIPGLGVINPSGGGGGNKGELSRVDNLSPGTFAKSLPPTPQHSPSSRKPSLVPTPSITVFDMITKSLESLPNDLSHLTTDYTLHIIEPLTGLSKQEDVMTVAKEASKSLYVDLNPTERVDKINALLIKLRLILDSKTNTYTNSSALVKNASTEIPVDEHGPTSSPHKQAHVLGNSEECMQALSVIMLYLCTGLQHAQNIAAH